MSGRGSIRRTTRSEGRSKALEPAAKAPIVVGHRGAPRDRIENTLESFEEALAQGADALECDVRVSLDGEAILYHDRTLERLARRRGSVEDLSSAAAQALCLRAPKREGARIAFLRELLALAGRTRTPVAIELKSPCGPEGLAPRARRRRAAEIVDRAVRKHSGARRHRMISFDLDLLDELASRGAPTPLGAIFDRPPSGPARARAARLSSLLVLHHGLLEKPTVARWAASTELPVWVYAIDSRAAARRAAAAAWRSGVALEAFISNCPGRLRKVLASG